MDKLKLYKLEVRNLKKYVIKPSKEDKTRIKKLEQQGGKISFNVNEKEYILEYTATGVYTNYIEFREHYNTGFMHKGNNVRSMDKHHKFNHTEYKLHKQIDKK
jgi:hypothetical protein|tara:strand:- start:2870 stop:3178 length:309 start_codon:yes stop_codon:yes gene_type:complete